MKGILVVIRGTDWNSVIKTELAGTIRKKGTSKSNAICCIIRVRKILQIKREKQLEKSGETSVAKYEYSDGEFLVVSNEDSKPCEDWILNLGCMFHMCPNWDWLLTYEMVSKDVVLMGNNASCKIANIGMIKIKMLDEVIRTLGDVRHVPNLKKSLISLSTLD